MYKIVLVTLDGVKSFSKEVDLSKLVVSLDDFSKKYFTENQWKAIIAVALARFPFIDKIRAEKSRDYEFSNEKYPPRDWKPTSDGVGITIEYSGRKTNRSNNLRAALAIKDGIRSIEGSYLSSADHLYLYHEARDSKAYVNVHYDDRSKRLLTQTPKESDIKMQPKISDNLESLNKIKLF